MAVRTTVKDNRDDYENLYSEEEQRNQQKVRPLRLTYSENGEHVLREEIETNT